MLIIKLATLTLCRITTNVPDRFIFEKSNLGGIGILNIESMMKRSTVNQLLKIKQIAEEFKPEVIDERPKVVKEHKQKVILKKEGIEQSNLLEGKRKIKYTEKNTLKLR